MSKNELESIYKLNFYKKQKNWRLAGGSRKKKEPSEAKNRSMMNKTYIINKSPPEEMLETPKLNEAFFESGPSAHQEKSIPVERSEADNKEFNENYLQDLIKKDALIREKYEKQHLDVKKTDVSDNEWIHAAKLYGQNMGINSDDMDILIYGWDHKKPTNFCEPNPDFKTYEGIAVNLSAGENNIWTNDINDWAHENIDSQCWLNPNMAWSNVEIEDDWAVPEVSEDLPHGLQWCSEAEEALAEADMYLYYDTQGQLSRWSSLDSAKFMLGAVAAPHSSEKDLTYLCPPSPGFLKALVSKQARALRQLLLQAKVVDMQVQANARSSQCPSFEEPTRDVGPNTPNPSLIRQNTFTRRPNSGPSCGPNWQDYANIGQDFNYNGQYVYNNGQDLNNHGQLTANNEQNFNNDDQSFSQFGQNSKNSSFNCGSFKDLNEFEGNTRRERVILRGGRPYRVYC